MSVYLHVCVNLIENTSCFFRYKKHQRIQQKQQKAKINHSTSIALSPRNNREWNENALQRNENCFLANLSRPQVIKSNQIHFNLSGEAPINFWDSCGVK